MPSFEPVRFGLIGSGWITEQHIAAMKQTSEVEVVACADVVRERGGRPGRGSAMAGRLGIGTYFADHHALLEDPRIEAVTVSLPNALHAPIAMDALRAKKHVVIEKPLCLTLGEADSLIELADENGVQIGYAEELCFAPKFVRAKALVDGGAIGPLYFIQQTEAHAGPYSEWFFDPALAGGGALMDMGCHSIEYARWMFDKAPVERVTAHLSRHLHQERVVDDHCVVHLFFQGGGSALVEAGWNLKGGMRSTAHLRGSSGALDVDLLSETGLTLFSDSGAEALDVGKGWSKPDYEWLWQNGYPQEMAEFGRAFREGRQPSESAKDGRAVLEIMWAAYASAREQRTISLPYEPPNDVASPVDLWRQGMGDP